MAKVPTDLSGRKVRAALERAGFVFLRKKGGHMILHRGNPPAWVTVPNHRQVKGRHTPGDYRGCGTDSCRVHEALEVTPGQDMAEKAARPFSYPASAAA